MKYVSLHHHSTFSYMDGHRTPEAHVKRSAELGMTAMALTEHGNVSSHPQLEKAASKAGIKPLFGLEAYTALGPNERRKFHLTILAMDQVGYSNLMKLVSRSWAEGFYQWPTVSGSMLAEHNEGLIVLSGCSDSLLACYLLGGKTIEPAEASYERAVRQAKRYKEIFGDRFYLETQLFPELDRTHHINGAYERMGSQLGIPLVATSDVHYPMPDDNEIQVVLHAAGRGAGSVAAQEAGWEYDIRLTLPTSDQVAFDRALGTGLSRSAAQQACRSTMEIAERCNVVLPKAERLRYPDPKPSLELIWEWLRKGWRYRIDHGDTYLAEHADEVAERINYEMREIVNKDFVDYFLMTSDIVRHAKNHGVVVGPARGSAASSLVCYLLRITEVNPLQFPLMLFERFIAPDRDDMPDIDLDFDDDYRGIAREYAVERYGEERIGNVANYQKFKGKSALADVGRVFPRIPKPDIELAKSMVIERSGGDSRADAGLIDTVEMFPQVKAIFDRYPDLYKATRLEGDYRGMSVNAAGFVIANTPITDICAQYTRDAKDKITGESYKRTVISVDKKDAEYLGLMKIDFLGLSTMGMLRIALDLAGLTLEDLYAIPLDDQPTIDAFHKNDVVGIFQFEGRATRLVNREVAPDTFWELPDINGLSRPGPLFSGTTADYIDIKHGNKKRESLHPLWDDITKHTHGQVIYQEQVLKALKEIGLLPVTRVGEIRRIISKKLGEAQFNESMNDFAAGAARLGINQKMAEHMWGRLVTSASYSFVYAHAASYALIAWWSMWLKVHYPAQFYTAALRKAKAGAEGQTGHGGTHTNNLVRLVKDAGNHGVPVRWVDPQKSGMTWTTHRGLRWRSKRDVVGVECDEIIAGWTQVPGIGPSKAQAITDHIESLPRAERPHFKMENLIDVKGIGPAMMSKITAVDPHDPFELGRVARVLTEVRNDIKRGAIALPSPTHLSDGILDAKSDSTVRFLGLVKLKEYKDWIEDERARTGDSLDDIKARMRDPHLPTGCVLHCYDDGDEDVYVRVDRRVYPRFRRALEDIRVNHDLILAVARKSRNSFGASIYVKELYVITPDD